MSRSDPIVSDSGPLISLAENCITWVLRKIANPIIIPKAVEYEAVIHPLKINRYEFNAMRIRQMIDEGEILIDKTDVSKKTKEIMGLVNNLVFYKNKPLHIMHEGESEVLALALERGLSTVLIDERTARLVVENPRQIKDYMESRLDLDLRVNENNMKKLEGMFRNVKVLRSTEIAVFAYENGLLSEYGTGTGVLEAALYGLKHTGCAINEREIGEYIALINSEGNK